MAFLMWKQTARSQCAEQGNVWDKSWVSCTETANPNPVRPVSHWLLFEFDQPESINTSKIWNANRASESSMGVQQMFVDYSIDGTNWISLGSFNIARAAESEFYTGAVGPSFGGEFVKKILFTVQTTHGDPNCASLAEVQFNIDPTVCYGIEDECGICNGPGKLIWYRDADGDGLGDPDNVQLSCTQPSGYIPVAGDLCDSGVYGWAEIGSLFEDNGCTGCHGTSGGLDLRSYATISLGGNKCGSNLLTGNNLVGIITIPGFAGCSQAISGPTMNENVGGAMDNDELAMIQDWVDSGAPEFCQCPDGAPDSDNDGVCDDLDFCPGFNNQLIGTACDDHHPCTINDVYDMNCNCVGEPAPDADDDGVCDALDLAPNEPCTADGVIDGDEPINWTGSINNDCDGDGIPLGQGDIDDFVACINQFGFVPTADCICETDIKIGGGRFVSQIGVVRPHENAGGIPDGSLSGNIGSNDELVLAYPYLPVNTDICYTLGFSESGGIAAFELNDLGTYLFENTANLINFDLQQYCITTLEDGPQEIVITRQGTGGLKIDGSTFNYCPCSISDFEELSPDCQCPSNQFQFTGNYVSEVGGVVDPANAAGTPDGEFTSNVGSFDTLTLEYPQLRPSSKICITVGFSDVLGVGHFEQSGITYSFSNEANIISWVGQEFCFVTPDVLTDNYLYITEFGGGAIRVDGSTVSACSDCLPSQPDSDGDGLCDDNDPCPNSVSNDSDNDGICDDNDICIGFDDNIDSDGDGVPNGCDICPSGKDYVDTDGDGVPNACDQCAGNDDKLDFDGDGIPNGCDSAPCVNFITELTSPLIQADRAANFQILSNGYTENNSDLIYTGGQSLFFEKGFEVKSGATFLATIDPCPN